MRNTTRTVRTLIAAGGAAAMLAGCNSADGEAKAAPVTSSTSASSSAATSATGESSASSVAATTQASSTTTSAASASTAADGDKSLPDSSKATQQLRTKSGAKQVSVVSVRKTDGGASTTASYDGATLESGDKITFWQYVNTGGVWSWTKDGSLGRLPTVGGSSTPTLTGGSVKNSPNPVFIVKGALTGNGTGQAIAYQHHARAGWGVLTAQPDKSLRSSGKGLTELGQNGLELNITVQDGLLVTNSLWGKSADAALAQQTSDPVIRTWYGDGQGGFKMQGETGGNSGGSS